MRDVDNLLIKYFSYTDDDNGDILLAGFGFGYKFQQETANNAEILYCSGVCANTIHYLFLHTHNSMRQLFNVTEEISGVAPTATCQFCTRTVDRAQQPRWVRRVEKRDFQVSTSSPAYVSVPFYIGLFNYTPLGSILRYLFNY